MISSVMISGNILLIVYTAFVFSYAHQHRRRRASS